MGAVAVTIAGVGAVFMFAQSHAATPKPAHHVALVPDAGAILRMTRMSSSMHHVVAMAETRMTKKRAREAAAAHRRHLAALAAARREARARARATHSAPASPPPTSSPSPTPPSSGGTDAAHSALGNCIRNAEEGGSYAWGPGNGGGAYQFVLGTWERYGGAASEYGVADASYQDKVFDNAIAEGGASNWTNYDGC
jgi:hypothetical protein